MANQKDIDQPQGIEKQPVVSMGDVKPGVEMAFRQEDLDNLLRQKAKTIYLVGGTFQIPAECRNIRFIELNQPTVTYHGVCEAPLFTPPVETVQPAVEPASVSPHKPPAERMIWVGKEIVWMEGVSGRRGSRLSSRLSSRRSSWVSSRHSGSFSEVPDLCGYGLDLI